jgi:hypothetical protein
MRSLTMKWPSKRSSGKRLRDHLDVLCQDERQQRFVARQQIANPGAERPSPLK